MDFISVTKWKTHSKHSFATTMDKISIINAFESLRHFVLIQHYSPIRKASLCSLSNVTDHLSLSISICCYLVLFGILLYRNFEFIRERVSAIVLFLHWIYYPPVLVSSN